MIIINPLVEKYNTPDTLVMVSLYPKKGELYSKGTSGLASYAKNVVSRMDRPVIVLADYETQPDVYEEDNVLVVRCFKRDTLRMWSDITAQLKLFTHASKLMIQFDFGVYGSPITSAGIIPFMAWAKTQGYDTSLVSHHVVTDVGKLKGHLGIDNTILGKAKHLVYSGLFRSFYAAASYLTHNIIVLEDTLKRKMNRVLPKKNVIAIPHGVDTTLHRMSKAKAREILGLPKDEYVVMFFGYVNWFKGADIFARSFAKTKSLLGKKTHFVIAGGISPTMKDKGFYEDYFDDVSNTVKHSRNVSMTGYIPQEKLAAYFAAADLVVFPYRHYMTASGVMSLVFSYRVPFIISKPLLGMFASDDFKNVLESIHLHTEDLVFDLNRSSMIATTERVLKNGLKAKTRKLARTMSEVRDYERVSKLYDKVLFAPSLKLAKSYRLRYT